MLRTGHIQADRAVALRRGDCGGLTWPDRVPARSTDDDLLFIQAVKEVARAAHYMGLQAGSHPDWSEWYTVMGGHHRVNIWARRARPSTLDGRRDYAADRSRGRSASDARIPERRRRPPARHGCDLCGQTSNHDATATL
ncbi:hypothetical protein LTS16_019949 [Friedmanniomyces endolithicus]|nr:hypothetical protein LTS16_019949 [Friedmanniomyces endolithicus]